MDTSCHCLVRRWLGDDLVHNAQYYFLADVLQLYAQGSKCRPSFMNRAYSRWGAVAGTLSVGFTCRALCRVLLLACTRACGFGWRALIAAEMIGGDSGLGFMIFTSLD